MLQTNFLTLFQGLVQTLVPSDLSIFSANGHLALAMPNIQTELHGRNFRRRLKTAGLDPAFFKTLPCQNLTLLWSGAHGIYQAAAAQPTYLGRNFRLQRLSRTPAENQLLALVFEQMEPVSGLDTGSELLPFQLGIPVYYNGTCYAPNLDARRAGWVWETGTSKGLVLPTPALEQTTVLINGELHTDERLPTAPVLIAQISGNTATEPVDLYQTVTTAMRAQLLTTPIGETGFPLEHSADFLEAQTIRQLRSLNAGKSTEAAVLGTLLGMGVRERVCWETQRGELGFRRVPERLLPHPYVLAGYNPLASALLPVDLPFVPKQSAPPDAIAVLPEVTIANVSSDLEDYPIWLVDSITAGPYPLPWLLILEEGESFLLNGVKAEPLSRWETPRILVTQGDLSLNAFWLHLAEKEALLKAILWAFETQLEDAWSTCLEDCMLPGDGFEIDTYLTAAVLLHAFTALAPNQKTLIANILPALQTSALIQAERINALSAEIECQPAAAALGQARQAILAARKAVLADYTYQERS